MISEAQVRRFDMRCGVLLTAVVLAGCQPATETVQPRDHHHSVPSRPDGPGAFEGPDLSVPFKKIELGMSREEVRQLMRTAPTRVTDLLLEYEGRFAAGEPFPVRNVYRITFTDGAVTHTQRTISACIYQVPLEGP